MILSSKRDSFSVFLVFILILTSCGRETTDPRLAAMKSDQAINELNKSASEALNAEQADASKSLRGVLEDLMASGALEVQTSKGRQAISTGFDSTRALEFLDKVLKLFADGQVTNLFTVAMELLEASKNDAGKVRVDLALVVQLLNAALPVITSVAPQFAPVVQALSVVLPMIDSFIKLFQKPKPGSSPRPSPTAVPNPSPSTSPKPSTTPRPSPTVVPVPTPTGPSGQALYDTKCSGCHALGSYDAAGSPNLSGKGSGVQGKFAAGVSSHMGITLSAQEISALVQFVNAH